MAEEKKPAEEKKEEKPAEAEEKKEETAEERAKKAGIEVEGAPRRKEEGKEKPKEKKVEKKGKKVRTGRKHEKTEAHKFYQLSGGNLTRNRKPCPRCGPGTWLAEHKRRLYCGRCGYTIFEKRG